MASDSPDLHALRQRLEEEEAAYASVLGAIDALASLPLPIEAQKELPAQVARLNALWETPPRPTGGGLAGAFRARAFDALGPALERQQSFNALLVQILNGRLEATDALYARLREFLAALVRYLQRVLSIMDIRDRMASALATTRAELILEAFDRRQETLARRLEGLLAMRDRLEAVSEEVRALRNSLGGAPAAPSPLPSTEESGYAAFENRFRGSREELRRRLATYVPLFEGLSPVVDLGCGRGEFLELLSEAGIEARGVEGNAHVARECRERGLDVVHGDLLDFLRSAARASLGGVFAAQVAEHLPPASLQATLAEAHRTLRPGGLLVLETVNPRSVVGFLEVYLRDLTHERPLHPDTLSFLAAAQGFTDVRVEMRSPVEAAARLRSIPPEGLTPATHAALSENVERLNGLLYGPQEYALLARR